MTARSFADTNVVVYTLDADTNKRHAAISVMRAHPVISVQVINEFLSVATGKMKLPRTTANRLAQILMQRCEVFDLTAEVVRHAIIESAIKKFPVRGEPVEPHNPSTSSGRTDL